MTRSLLGLNAFESVAVSVLATAVMLSAAAAPARAECSPEWLYGPQQQVPGTDGIVYAATMWDADGPGPEPERLVIGGYFSLAGGTSANHIARWDGTSWQPLGSGMEVGVGTFRPVRALAVYHGDLIAGGWFATAGGVTVNGIARWDGTDWQPLGTGTDGGVEALAVYNDELIAAGSFSSVDGVLVHSIARWNGTNWQSLGTGMGGESVWVMALRVYNGELIAGGTFDTAGGTSVYNIARWNGTRWTSLWNGTNDTVYALAEYDGALVAGGSFTRAGFAAANGVACWRGTTWQALGAGVAGDNPTVMALASYAGELYAAGHFTTAGDINANHVARWDGTQWRAVASGIDGPGSPMSGAGYDPTAYVLALCDGELLVGGFFSIAGGHAGAGMALWNGTEWHPWEPGLSHAVQTLFVWRGDLIAGGTFATSTGSQGIARWDGTAWQPFGSGVGGAAGAAVYCCAVYNDELVAGGRFTTADGVIVNGVARWDGATWQPLDTGMGGQYQDVFALVVYNGDLIAAGRFTSAGGVAANSIARWDGATWRPLGTGMSGQLDFNCILSLSVYNGELIAAGRFTGLGGAPSTGGIGRWDGTTWRSLGSGLSGGGANGTRLCLTDRGFSGIAA